jgi:hypothetical protein
LQNYNSEINNNFTIFKTNYEEQENLLKNKINDKQLEIEHLETEHKNKINFCGYLLIIFVPPILVYLYYLVLFIFFADSISIFILTFFKLFIFSSK